MQVEINSKEAYVLLRLINLWCPDNRTIKDLKQKLYEILDCREESEIPFRREYICEFIKGEN